MPEEIKKDDLNESTPTPILSVEIKSWELLISDKEQLDSLEKLKWIEEKYETSLDQPDQLKALYVKASSIQKLLKLFETENILPLKEEVKKWDKFITSYQNETTNFVKNLKSKIKKRMDELKTIEQQKLSPTNPIDIQDPEILKTDAVINQKHVHECKECGLKWE